MNKNAKNCTKMPKIAQKIQQQKLKSAYKKQKIAQL